MCVCVLPECGNNFSQVPGKSFGDGADRARGAWNQSDRKSAADATTKALCGYWLCFIDASRRASPPGQTGGI